MKLILLSFLKAAVIFDARALSQLIFLLDRPDPLPCPDPFIYLVTVHPLGRFVLVWIS